MWMWRRAWRLNSNHRPFLLPPLSPPLLPPPQAAPSDLMAREDLLPLLEGQLHGVMDPHVNIAEAAARIFRRGGGNLVYALVVQHVSSRGGEKEGGGRTK